MLAEEDPSGGNPMDFFSAFADGDDGDIPDMPYFECSNAEDRPLAPEADEYPLGCEVELRDKEYAKRAQGECHWEPFLDEIFSVPRRRVKVCRHEDDYTFVICSNITGYEFVGLTLYRACLSEPKVKTTKYYANIAAAREDDDFDRDPRRVAGKHEDRFSLEDPFDRPLDDDHMLSPPWIADVHSPPAVATAAKAGSGGGGGGGGGDTRASKTNGFVEEADRRQQLCLFDSDDAPPRFSQQATAQVSQSAPTVGVAAPSGSPHGNSATLGGHSRMTTTNLGQVRRRTKFAGLMKKGTEELERGNYERSLECYNAALQEAPEEEARVLSSRSVAFLLLNQTENALKDAKGVITLNPDSFLGYLRTANVLRGMKQYNDAQSYYKDALKRSPDNRTVRRLLLGNSVAMLYSARTKRFPLLKMVLDDANVRVLSVAKRNINKDDYVLRETTPMAAICSTQYATVLAKGTRKALLCHNCGKPFLDEESLRERIPGMHLDLFRTLCTDPKPVRCNYNCYSMYCSEDCRSKAWAFHHWVECSTRGRWREGVNAVHAYLDEYVLAHSPNGATPECPKINDASIAGNTSPMVIATTIRLTVRMFSRMLSCVWSLRDAVHMYDWIQVSPAVEAQDAQVLDILQNAYRLLSSNFKSDEKPKLSFELFQRCYKRAKSNSVALKVSSWNKLAIRAESLLNFVDADAPAPVLHCAAKLPNASSHNGSTSIAEVQNSRLSGNSNPASHSLSEEQKQTLAYILAAPPEGIPGMSFTVVALFEIFASMSATNLSNVRQHRPPRPSTERPASSRDRAEGQNPVQTIVPTPNLVVHSLLESNICLHVRATRMIKRGETLVVAAPEFDKPRPL